MIRNNKMDSHFSSTDHEVVEFNNQLHRRIKIDPIYFRLGFSPSPHIYGRRAVLDRLLLAVNSLPEKYGFLIWDVYRPRAVQGKIFNWMKEEARKRLPHLTDKEVDEETRKYAMPPPHPGENYCPAHLSGGAIDLTLYDVESGEELEMGTPFDECSERAHSHYFDGKGYLSEGEQEIKENRDRLRSVMEGVGFTSYQYEWWHFDIGDILWSRKLGCAEVFGPLFGDKEWP